MPRVVDRLSARQSRASYYAYRFLSSALQVVPSAAEEPIAKAAGYITYALKPRERQVVAANIERVLGNRLEGVQGQWWVRRAFDSYARYWVESARLRSEAAVDLDTRMVCSEGWEHLVNGMARGNGVVMALPHLGNFDFGGAWLATVGYPMTTVAERLDPAELFEWFVAQRKSIGLDVHALGPESGSVLLEALSKGGLVGLVSDRDIVGNGVEVELFGEPTTLPAGPAALALRSGSVLLPAAVYMDAGGSHRGVILAPLDTSRRGRFREDVQRVTCDLAGKLEELIRRAPEQWHMFQPAWPADRPLEGRDPCEQKAGGSGCG